MANTAAHDGGLKAPDEVQCRWMQSRFRGFMPVVVDLETGGFDEQTDALLELAAILIGVDENMRLFAGKTVHHHVEPFAGSRIEEAALKINRIDPFHPLRMARPEQAVLDDLFDQVRGAVRLYGCSRAILIGHNAFFDLKFLNAAIKRNKTGKNPFHEFSSLDTVTLGALACGQTVLSRVALACGLEWDEASAHSALYDAQVTAAIFCSIVNRHPLGRRKAVK